VKDYFKKRIVWLTYFLIRLTSKMANDEIRQIISKKLILILAPHPDDEILGLGGIFLQILQKGGKVNLVYLTDGEGSGVLPEKEEIRLQRIALSEQVCKKLGLDSSAIIRLRLPDGAIPHQGQNGFVGAVNSIKQLIETLKPDAVFATHPLDYWPFDHVACAHIAREAVNQSEHKTQLWYYWVWAWYNIRPWQLLKIKFRKLWKIDISDQMPQKKALMNVYLKAVTPDGKPWSGLLPKALLKAFEHPVEIIERII
jgi:LmbE family N-acetylglucosaminyl deacetylase